MQQQQPNGTHVSLEVIDEIFKTRISAGDITNLAAHKGKQARKVTDTPTRAWPDIAGE